jgi:catalase-peroxidase
MDMKDRELVALIGGGHTFGKSHGACPKGAGPSPKEDEDNPWPGLCQATFTSGFEGSWTAHPTRWDNDYFKYLVDYEWEKHKGPGGHYQWRVKESNTTKSPQAPIAYPPFSSETQKVMMLTTDVALSMDPEYKDYVKEFASNVTAFGDAFALVWYKLTTRDMGPASRCIGPNVPLPQPFQNDLPVHAHNNNAHFALADMDNVAYDLHKLMDAQFKKERKSGGDFVRLAYQCASTFRATDYQGGCNGARIMYSPGKDWPANQGLDNVLERLEPIKYKYGKHLSWADLIVLAGSVAVNRAGGPSLEFCAGRTDAKDGNGWKSLDFGNDELPKTIPAMVELYQRRGLTTKEFAALSWSSSPNSKFGSPYFRNLLDSGDTDVVTLGMKNHPELHVWAEYYASSPDNVIAEDFAAAWTKMMNADRFDGPTGNVCDCRNGASVSSSLLSISLQKSSTEPSYSMSYDPGQLLVALVIFVCGAMYAYTGHYQQRLRHTYQRIPH